MRTKFIVATTIAFSLLAALPKCDFFDRLLKPTRKSRRTGGRCQIRCAPSSWRQLKERPPNAVATVLGPVPVLLWQTGADSYRLLPRSSFADYVARWLLDAMTEYAAPAVP